MDRVILVLSNLLSHINHNFIKDCHIANTKLKKRPKLIRNHGDYDNPGLIPCVQVGYPVFEEELS